MRFHGCVYLVNDVSNVFLSVSVLCSMCLSLYFLRVRVYTDAFEYRLCVGHKVHHE